MTSEDEADARRHRGLVRLHIKSVVGFGGEIAVMLGAAREVYGAAGIRVDVISREALELPELARLAVGRCDARRLTAAQHRLFLNRNGARPTDVVAYFVGSTLPPSDGCAAHPPGAPGLVVVKGACKWTLAHELGHVLGLAHTDGDEFLMTGGGTANISCSVPRLSELELYVIGRSGLVQTL